MTQRSILIVEDDIEILEALQTALEQENYHVHLARNGREATQLISQMKSTWLLIVDLMLPLRDGFDLLQKVSPVLHNESVPVIVLAADSGARLFAAQYGYKLLLKPFDLHRLLAAVAASF